MACLPAYLIEKYQNQLARVQAQIAKLETAIDSALENSEVEEYSFNSGEGQQRTKRRDIKSLLQSLERLESSEARILRKLAGRGIVNVNLRRKRYNY